MSVSVTPVTHPVPVNGSKICCCSKSNVEVATGDVLVNSLTAEDLPLGDRFVRRFKEIYQNAVHENVSFDSKTWSEATEEGNRTLDFDPVNVARKTDMENSISLLDNVIVEATGKRKVFPVQISRILSKQLKHKRKANTSLPQDCQSKDAKIQRLNMSEEYLSIYRGRLEECFLSFATVISKKLPNLENKTTRLEEASKQSRNMRNNLTSRVLQKPHKDETTIVTSSATPLKRQYEELVSSTSSVSSLLKEFTSSQKLCKHPISRHHLRSTSLKL